MVGKRYLAERDNDVSKTDLESRGKTSRRSEFKDSRAPPANIRSNADLKEQLREGLSREEFEKYRKSPDELKRIKNKKIRAYYEDQNSKLDDWLEVDTLFMAMADDVLDSMNPDADRDGIPERAGALQNVKGSVEELLPDDVRDLRRRAIRNARWAININVVVNIALLGAKCIAAFSSSSLSLLASLVDSGLDLLCTVIIWSTNRIVQRRRSGLDQHFPVGRRRLEPLGILVFSIIMIVSFLQILQESVTKLVSNEGKTTELSAVAIGSMLGTVVVKGVLWFGCIRVKTTQVQALAQDCKTDVVFNTLSLLFPLIGHKAHVWWLDPAGAAILSLFIIFDWAKTLFENAIRLSGSTVESRLHKKLMYLAYRFAPAVDGFKNVVAYHAGDGVWVEYDILMPEATDLRHTHDIAETLQYCAEGLNEVDRAFVSVDYTPVGPLGHSADLL